MPELRWTLLILGALFIGGLALWEWRRQRHARGPQSAAPGPLAGHGGREGERISPTFDSSADGSFDAMTLPARGVFREPTLTFPEVTVTVPADSRDRFADPPVVELDDESLDRLKVEAGEAIDEFTDPSEDEIDPPVQVEPMIPRLSPAPTAPILAGAGEPATDASGQSDPYHQSEWLRLRDQAQQHAAGDSFEPHRARDPGEQYGDLRGAREFAENGESASTERSALDPHDEPTTRFDASERDASPVAASASVVASAADSAAPLVEWPDEDVRKIVALRLVSGLGERFAGRAVRLALAAEGFVLGKFDIFHKPGPDSRAVLSAASLTKPGTFALATMDAQRFGGLSLFAVLPGPLTPLATFDELMATARALNDRLRGALQDERGEPLTPMRSASIRDGLTAAASAAAPVIGAAAAPPVVDSPGSTTPA